MVRLMKLMRQNMIGLIMVKNTIFIILVDAQTGTLLDLHMEEQETGIGY